MKLKILGVLVLFSFAATMASAQAKADADIAEAVQNLRRAMLDGDSVALKRITSANLSYGHSSGQIDDKKIFVDKLSTGKSDFVTMELSEQTIAVSGKVAIVRHLLHGTTNDGGKPGEVHLRVMLVFQKEGKYWKLLARQAVKI